MAKALVIVDHQLTCLFDTVESRIGVAVLLGMVLTFRRACTAEFLGTLECPFHCRLFSVWARQRGAGLVWLLFARQAIVMIGGFAIVAYPIESPHE